MANEPANETATIRVSRRTRDLLTEQARERGVSVAALLGEIARELEAEAIWGSEPEPGHNGDGDGDSDGLTWETVLAAGSE
jgi:antitoxin MazE7